MERVRRKKKNPWRRIANTQEMDQFVEKKQFYCLEKAAFGWQFDQFGFMSLGSHL